MAAAMNGMALHGGLKVVRRYVLRILRLPASGSSSVPRLMKLPVVYVLTHDSIAVGEDGPTHEPIEQLPRFASSRTLRSFVRPTRTKLPQHGAYAVEEERRPSSSRADSSKPADP